MAKLKFVDPKSNVVKIGTKQAIQRRLWRNLLISFWIIQTLCTIGYVYFSLQ